MDLAELIARVEDAGISLRWTRFSRINAGWDADRRTIWIDDRIEATPRRAVSVLAHEFAHALLGHVGPQGPVEEARADTVAASLLINVEDYAELERAGYDHATIAAELGVTEHLLDVFRQRLRRAA